MFNWRESTNHEVDSCQLIHQRLRALVLGGISALSNWVSQKVLKIIKSLLTFKYLQRSVFAVDSFWNPPGVSPLASPVSPTAWWQAVPKSTLHKTDQQKGIVSCVQIPWSKVLRRADLALFQEILQTVLLCWSFIASCLWSSRLILLRIPSRYRLRSNCPAPSGMLQSDKSR